MKTLFGLHESEIEFHFFSTPFMKCLECINHVMYSLHCSVKHLMVGDYIAYFIKHLLAPPLGWDVKIMSFNG